MLVTPTACEVRFIVDRTFSELGVDQDAIADLNETLMVDEGRLRARSYRLDDFMAMWLIDVGILQFYDGEGNMLRRKNLLAQIEPRPMAA